jgi:hypothetical protein
MSDSPTAPADVVAELDEVIAQAEQAEGTEGIDATGLAEQMAADFNVDLAEVTGSGKGGRITVPDVEKFIKAREAEAEAPAEAEKAPAKPKAKAKAKPKAKATAAQPLAVDGLPHITKGLVEVHHTIRALAEHGSGDWFNSIVSVEDADDNLSTMMSEGWSLLKTQSLGYGPDGIEMLWVFGRFAEEPEVREWPYREIHHITRRVGGLGDDGRGISGLAANALINGYLSEGWDLAHAEGLDKSQGGAVNMMWILVR